MPAHLSSGGACCHLSCRSTSPPQTCPYLPWSVAPSIPMTPLRQRTPRYPPRHRHWATGPPISRQRSPSHCGCILACRRYLHLYPDSNNQSSSPTHPPNSISQAYPPKPDHQYSIPSIPPQYFLWLSSPYFISASDYWIVRVCNSGRISRPLSVHYSTRPSWSYPSRPANPSPSKWSSRIGVHTWSSFWAYSARLLFSSRPPRSPHRSPLRSHSPHYHYLRQNCLRKRESAIFASRFSDSGTGLEVTEPAGCASRAFGWSGRRCFVFQTSPAPPQDSHENQ